MRLALKQKIFWEDQTSLRIAELVNGSKMLHFPILLAMNASLFKDTLTINLAA